MLEVYVNQDGKRLRCGYTTGTCAALAAQGAAKMLLGGETPQTVCLMTPKGIEVKVPLCECRCDGQEAVCAVVKDSGDDFDVTEGTLIYARVTRRTEGFEIDGGEGVGRVTRNGLEQPVGAAAINRVPRKMIEEQLRAAAEAYDAPCGLKAEIFVPQGKELAEKTFNPNLGIVGGISILGTSGIVEPQSLQALFESIKVELKMHAACGGKKLILTPGNYGEDFLKEFWSDLQCPVVKCANFIGDCLDEAALLGYEQVLLVGHIGKFVKLAGGIMNTHSRWADCRAELFAAHGAFCGGTTEMTKRLMESISTDECIEILEEYGMRECVLRSLLSKIEWHLQKRAGAGMQTAAVIFSNRYGLLGQTEGAESMRKAMEVSHG